MRYLADNEISPTIPRQEIGLIIQFMNYRKVFTGRRLRRRAAFPSMKITERLTPESQRAACGGMISAVIRVGTPGDPQSCG